MAGVCGHSQAVLGAKGDDGVYIDALARDGLQPPTLGEESQKQDALRPSVSLADALATPAAERKIGVLGPAGDPFRSPARRVEAVRVGVVAGIVVDDILAEIQERAGRDEVLAKLAVFHIAPRDDPYGRVDAH